MMAKTPITPAPIAKEIHAASCARWYRRWPIRFPTALTAPSETPSGIMKEKLARLRTIAWAASASVPRPPARSVAIWNAQTSSPIWMPTGVPCRRHLGEPRKTEGLAAPGRPRVRMEPAAQDEREEREEEEKARDAGGETRAVTPSAGQPRWP
jgi:hypothetical protein